MNERQTKYMLTISRKGSISRVAKVLCVSQPSVSQMMQKVEGELRADLSAHYTNPLMPVLAGEYYTQAARTIRNVQQNLDHQPGEIRFGTHGSIRLDMPLQCSLELLSDILPHFHACYLAVNLKLTEPGPDVLETILLNRQLDIAYLMTSAKTNPLDYIFVSRGELVLLASENTVLAECMENGTPIDVREAEEEALVSLRNGYSTRITQDRLFMDAYISSEILFGTEGVKVVKHAAGPYQTMFLCPKNYIGILPEVRETCVMYPMVGVKQERHFYICHQKGQCLVHYMAELIRLLKPDFGLSRSEEFPESWRR